MSVPAGPPMQTPGVGRPMGNGGFSANTALWTQPMAAIPRPVGGGTSPVAIMPRVGLLAAIRFAIRGSIAGTLTVPNALGMASIINRIRVNINGNLDLV